MIVDPKDFNLESLQAVDKAGKFTLGWYVTYQCVLYMATFFFIGKEDSVLLNKVKGRHSSETLTVEEFLTKAKPAEERRVLQATSTMLGSKKCYQTMTYFSLENPNGYS